MTTEWIEYTGSDEQIAELRNAKNGFTLRYQNYEQTEIFRAVGSSFIGDPIDLKRRMLSGDNLSEVLNRKNITHYLLCNPHPRANMICQQARTGQPVWVRVDKDSCGNKINMIYETTTPDWNIPNAEYRFTPFKEEL